MFLKNLLQILTTKIGVLVVGLLTMILMVKGLGVDGRGVLAALLIYPQLFVSLLEGGMRQTATLYLGKKIEQSSTVLGSVFIYGAIVGVAGAIVSFVTILNTSIFDYTLVAIIIASLLIPVQLYVAYLKGIFLGFEHYKNVNKILFIPKIIILLSLLVIDLFGTMSVLSVVIITFVGNVFNLFQSLYYLRRLNISTTNYSLKKTYKMFKQGIPYAISLFLIVANYKLDILLLSQWGNSTDVGNYIICVQFGELLWQLPAALSLMLMIKSAKANNREKFSSNITLISRLSISLCFVSGIMLYFILPIGIGFILNPESGKNIQEIYAYLLPGLFAMVVFKLVNSDLAGNGEPIYSVYIMAPAVLLNIAFNYLLIPDFGGVGAAIASSISYILITIGIVLIHSRKYNHYFLSYFLIKSSDFTFIYNKIKNLII